MSSKLEIFEAAFRINAGSSVGDCPCGRTYYNPGGCWDWCEGELERLDKNPTAIGVDHSVGFVVFEGSHYVDACDCWHQRAERIMAFISRHSHQICRYLADEKALMQTKVDQMPVPPLGGES